MGLVGSLEDLGLGDILQIVSLSRKSGLLNLGCGGVKGKIFFNDGQVVAAVSTAKKISIGAVLVKEGVLPTTSQDQVDARVGAQADAEAVKGILVGEFKVSAEIVEEKIREQIETVVFSFFTWPEGTFSFELQDIEKEKAALNDPDHAFVLQIGLSPQFLAMEGTRLQDEFKRSQADAPVGPPLKGMEAPPPAEPEEPPPPDLETGIEEITMQHGSPGPDEDSETSFAALSNTVVKPIAEPEPPPAAGAAGEPQFSSVEEAVAFYESQAATDSGAPDPAPPMAAEQAPEPPEPSRPEPIKMETALFEQAAAATPDKPVEDKPAAAPVRTSEPAAAPKGQRLVIIDDDALLLESLAHHLPGKGYSVQTFTGVAEAVAGIQQKVDAGEKPAVVVADLIMPNSDGSGTLGGLEALEKTKVINPSISLILISDYENLPARARSEELGAAFFFMKPKSSQLDEDYGSPELLNFVSVLDDSLKTLVRKTVAAEPEGMEMINLGEELRREFGEDVVPIDSEAEKITPSPGLHMLKTMISELNDPTSNGQITLLILRFAAEMMNRSVIFLVARNQLAGLGQFGITLDGADPQKHVRKIRIPLNEPSIFREAIQKRLPLKKPLKNNKWNQYLVDSLGSVKPQEVFVAPIIAGGKIAALLYGDNVPEDKEIGDTESLEIFLAQAGLAMEKALLERRLKEMDAMSARP